MKESVKTGCWFGDAFLFTNASNRLMYYVGGEMVTVAHLDRPMYLLGYLASANRVFLADRDLNASEYLSNFYHNRTALLNCVIERYALCQQCLFCPCLHSAKSQ